VFVLFNCKFKPISFPFFLYFHVSSGCMNLEHSSLEKMGDASAAAMDEEAAPAADLNLSSWADEMVNSCGVCGMLCSHACCPGQSTSIMSSENWKTDKWYVEEACESTHGCAFPVFICSV